MSHRLPVETTFVRLGLLTTRECAVLLPMKNKKRDTVLGWISCEIQHGVGSGLLAPTCAVTALDNTALLRGKCAAFHDQFATNQPALWAALMIFMVCAAMCRDPHTRIRCHPAPHDTHTHDALLKTRVHCELMARQMP